MTTKTKTKREDYRGFYRIKNTSAVHMDEHEQHAWNRIINYIKSNGGQAHTSALELVLAEDESADYRTVNPCQFLEHIIRHMELLEKVNGDG